MKTYQVNYTQNERVILGHLHALREVLFNIPHPNYLNEDIEDICEKAMNMTFKIYSQGGERKNV